MRGTKVKRLRNFYKLFMEKNEAKEDPKYPKRFWRRFKKEAR